MNAADARTIAQTWAKGLNDEQLAARLLANAEDYRWSPVPQRVALLAEAAARIFDGKPKLAKAPLPSLPKEPALTVVPPVVEPDASRNDEADHGGPAAKTGDPRVDRKAGSMRELEARATAEETCPTCQAGPGAPCTRTTAKGVTTLRHPHAERAAALGKRLGAEAQAEIDGGQA